MERLIAAISAMAGQIPALAWLGYVHTTRPSRKECDAKHNGVCVKLDAMSEKIDALQKHVENTNALIIRHITKE